ncbi:hypothetical protein B4117_5482 [Bacillus mycoides]|nr:hypothetical protein B4117_5482 [Bacillus mycoides]
MSPTEFDYTEPRTIKIVQELISRGEELVYFTIEDFREQK